jgi:hypothetical protein
MKAFNRVADRRHWTLWVMFVAVMVGPISALPIIYAGYRIMRNYEPQ